MNRNIRHLLKLVFGVATLYFACVWAKFFPGPSWLPENVEPLTVIAGALLFFISWWEEIFEKMPQALRREPKYLTNPHRHLSSEAIGRKKDLRVLRRKLLSAKKPIVICGVGGLGKTTVAQMFWQQNKKRFDHVAWLVSGAIFTGDKKRRSKNEKFFINAFVDNEVLKKSLDIILDPQHRPEKQFEQIVATLGEVSGKNLLVIDNVPEAASTYFDTLSGLENWKILLTSRDEIQNTEVFELGVLEPKKAAEVFQRIYTRDGIMKFGMGEETKNLHFVLRGIGYHTLTIELIAAYAREKKLTVTNLLAELQHRGLSKLDEVDLDNPKSSKKQSFNAHLRDTFLLELSPMEQEVMRYCCILPPDGADVDPALMTEEKLCEYFEKNDDPVSFHNVLKGLARLHWLAERAGAFFCHPVVAETAKDQLKPDAENCAVLIKNITQLLTPAKNEPILARAPFVPLGEAVIQGVYRKNEEFTKADDAVAQLALLFGPLLEDLGLLHKSLDYSLKMVAIGEKNLPDKHKDLATFYTRLASSFGALGEHKKRLEFNLKAKAIREKVLPAIHNDLATSYNNLSSTYWELGEYKKAMEFGLKAHAIWKKNLPPEDPHIGLSYTNLGEVHRALEEFDKALEFNLKAKNLREKILPADHADLAQTYNNLALAYGELKNHKDALEFHLKAIAIREKILPAEHPDLAQSYSNIALTYKELGDNLKQLKFNLKAKDIWEKVVPAEHPHLAVSYNNLSRAYRALGDLENAYFYIKKSVFIFEASLPPTHPWLIKSKEYLVLIEQKRREQGHNT